MELSLSLYPATPEQVILSNKRTHLSWSRGLDINTYLRKEQFLQKSLHAVDGKFVVWVLAPRTDPTTLDFFCSCETYRRDGLAKTDKERPVDLVRCYGVASVYTPSAHRNKGYAKHMMRLLHWVLAPPSSPRLGAFPEAWGAPPSALPGFHDAAFSALYSDLGSVFYALCGPFSGSPGWLVRDPLTTIWQIEPDNAHPALPTGVEWLSLDAVSGILEKDVDRMKDELSQKDRAFAFLPTGGVYGFQVQRTAVLTPDISVEPQLPLSVWGVSLNKDDTFATWATEPGSDIPTLVITRLQATRETFPALLELIKHFARQIGTSIIEAWNIRADADLVHSSGGVSSLRDNHLPSVIWYGDGDGDGFEWAFNEKFAWC